MGRGPVQLRRIENKINRQVTFSKRRNGLMKKAHEISVLCDADVALIIFSTKGKLFQYSTGDRMEQILEKFQRYSLAEKAVSETETVSQDSLSNNCVIIKSKIEALQKNQRHLMGEELDSLTMKELQHLEQQLEASLKQIRTRKDKVYHDCIVELHQKEKLLEEENSSLEKLLAKGREKEMPTQQMLSGKQTQAQTKPLLASTLMVTDSLTALNIGPPGVEVETPVALPSSQTDCSSLPPWMLNHSSGG
ncbi:MADS box transcription factor [Rhynchospora pubera]|uniref:MADS box transcription factor n=1 Tax=Rhynchospora pubera TaxID=906938 RepID=A0AAV8CMS4_9POAL|nr:MADS box transcription factor [Rhynchospora pubera]